MFTSYSLFMVVEQSSLQIGGWMTLSFCIFPSGGCKEVNSNTTDDQLLHSVKTQHALCIVFAQRKPLKLGGRPLNSEATHPKSVIAVMCILCPRNAEI